MVAPSDLGVPIRQRFARSACGGYRYKPWDEPILVQRKFFQFLALFPRSSAEGCPLVSVELPWPAGYTRGNGTVATSSIAPHNCEALYTRAFFIPVIADAGFK